jgi:hypothetical protein
VRFDQLTVGQLYEMAAELETFAMAKTFHTLCARWFPTGVAVETEWESEYNDEGGFDRRLDDLWVYDAHGTRLDPILPADYHGGAVDGWGALRDDEDWYHFPITEDRLTFQPLPRLTFSGEIMRTLLSDDPHKR